MTANYELTGEDLEVVKSILGGYRQDGVENPLLPIDIDADDDGVLDEHVDAFGLDADGSVIVVKGVKLTDTVYKATEGDFMVGGV